LQARLQKIRQDATEWAMLSDEFASDKKRRQICTEVAACLAELVGEIEKIVTAAKH
jgi:hypothetical protein